jgi:general secretion pathway protein C
MLRRLLWAVPIVAGAGATWLVASGFTALLGGSLAPFDPRSLLRPSSPAPTSAPPPPRLLHAAAWVDQPPIAVAAEPSDAAPSAAAGRCEGRARLVVAAVDPLVPERSLAVIEEAGSKPLVRAGSELGAQRVARITTTRVYLEGDHGLCWIGTDVVARVEGGPGAGAPSASVAGGAAVAADPLAPLLDRIHRVDARTFEVDRAVRDALVDRQLELLKELRVSPERVGDRVVGMKLGAVRPGSLIARMGLRAGDRIVTLNGYELADPGQLLEAYAKLRAAPRLVLALVRDGQPQSVELQVR